MSNPIEQALSEFKQAGATDAESEAAAKIAQVLETALKAAVGDEGLDLTKMAPRELEGADAAAWSRRSYVAALLKLFDYLRQPADTMTEKEAQARVGLSYIRHVESNDLDALKPGRGSMGDQELMERQKTVRAKIDALADKRAEILVKEKLKDIERTVDAEVIETLRNNDGEEEGGR